ELLAVLALAVGFYREPAWRVTSHLFVALATEQLWGSAAPEGAEMYRAATLAFACALTAFGVALFPARERASRPRRAWLVGATCLALGLVTDRVATRTLAPSHAALLEAYGYVKQRGPLVLHADPAAVSAADIDLLLAEGTLWLSRIHCRLGLAPREQIHVFVHANAEEKRRWTGASRADFALPWRHEVHVRLGGAPHPTLGHELVHVIAGELLTSTFRTPSRWIVVQRPALIEGLAVAVTPELKGEQDLTVLEDAAALKRLHLLPPTRDLIGGLAFLGEAHQRAYVAAGAALRAFAQSQPDSARALREVYRLGSLEAAAGSSEAARTFYASYEATLDSLALPDGALSSAGGQFAEPSILTGTCPGQPAPAPSTWRTQARTGRVREALQAIAHDSGATSFWLVQGEALAAGDTAGAVLAWRAILDRTDSVTLAGSALREGDLLARAGRLEDAQAAWERVPARFAAPAYARGLAARRILAAELRTGTRAHPVAESALRYLTSGDDREQQSAALALSAALARGDGAAGSATTEPALVRSLAAYLLARRLRDLRDAASSARLLARVHADALLPEPIAGEALAMHAQALALEGHGADAARLLRDAVPTATRRAQRLRLEDLAERAERGARAPARPSVLRESSDPAWADRLLVGAPSTLR
ncbi:MAG: hypothetical protein HY275_19605, partial [Gemmatimonadetes bacterium]|nr:hypothetical protein [Gemmatimonadota bacterium]